MLRKPYFAAVLVIGLTFRADAAQPTAAPDWWQLEEDYAKTHDITLAQRAIAQAIPLGISSKVAVATLVRDGATCKTERRDASKTRCLIHQYSLADGAADDIRWTIILSDHAGDLNFLSLDRYVDRHGSS